MDLEREHQSGLCPSPGRRMRCPVDQGCLPAGQARRGLCDGIPDAAIQGEVLSTEVSDPDPGELIEWALGSIPAAPPSNSPSRSGLSVRSSTTARAGRPFTAVLETARIPERVEDVKQKALRIADLLLA